jgi:hypothetical protein
MASVIPRSAYSVRMKKFYDWLAGLTTVKTANEAKTGTTTLGADDTLKFAVEANRKYRFRAVVFFDTTAAGDFKYRVTGPADPTLVRLLRYCVIPGATALSDIAVDVAFSSSDISEAGSGTTGGCIVIEGIVHNGANAGTVAIEWAPNASDAGNTTVLAGSSISYELIA